MKTFAAVVCALLASSGAALANGTSAGAPVVSPVRASVGGSRSMGSPVTTPIGFQVSDNAPSAQPDRRRKTRIYPANPGLWDPKICRPPVYIFTPFEVYVRAEQPPVCGLYNEVVAQSAPAAEPPAPLWLPPAFMW